jgi:hypothetical protein
MPSKAMVQYKVGMYPEESERMERLIHDEDVPSGRLLLESFMFILEDPQALAYVINKCREKRYRATGANVGEWKKTQIRKFKNAKEKSNTQSQES